MHGKQLVQKQSRLVMVKEHKPCPTTLTVVNVGGDWEVQTKLPVHEKIKHLKNGR